MEVLARASRPAMSAASMVERYLKTRGISDARVLAAMAEIPREQFVPEVLRERAYSDHPLPIGEDQTITQPYVVAMMTEALSLSGIERVLEIGTGSGYQTAVLAKLAKSVYSVERIRSLVPEARKRIESLDLHNVSIRAANGAFGWQEYAPFDAILVTAAAKTLPDSLLSQLTMGGRMVCPLESADGEQNVYRIRKTSNGSERSLLGPCSFVPFVV